MHWFYNVCYLNRPEYTKQQHLFYCICHQNRSEYVKNTHWFYCVSHPNMSEYAKQNSMCFIAFAIRTRPDRLTNALVLLRLPSGYARICKTKHSIGFIAFAIRITHRNLRIHLKKTHWFDCVCHYNKGSESHNNKNNFGFTAFAILITHRNRIIRNKNIVFITFASESTIGIS